MKLMDLRAAIRKPGNPEMMIDLGNGVPMKIAFQKAALLEELGRAFEDERTRETGLSYDNTTSTLSVVGFIGTEPVGGSTEEDDPIASEDTIDDDEDDLL